MVIIQPFTYQMSTAFKERVDLADKLNEVIDLLNAWGDVPEQFEQVQEQIQSIGQQINDITTKISTIETNLGQLQTTVTNLGAKLNRAAVASTLSTTDHIDSEKVGIAIDSIDGTTNKVSYLVGATAENAGLMTAADKEKLDDAITEIPIASTTQLGAIKVGANLQITADGTLNASGGGGEPTVTLPAHIVGANDTNALVSVSPVRQNGNLLIRTTYKDYTTAGTTAKNVDGGPFPIASAEDSGLMAATDKQTLDSVKDVTDAMSTTVDAIQGDLDTLEQNFQDLKGDMLTNPAEVVQVADETHDGIITKEKFQSIGQVIIKDFENFLQIETPNLKSTITITSISSSDSTSFDYCDPDNPEQGLQIDNPGLIFTNAQLFNFKSQSGITGGRTSGYRMNASSVSSLSQNLFAAVPRSAASNSISQAYLLGYLLYNQRKYYVMAGLFSSSEVINTFKMKNGNLIKIFNLSISLPTTIWYAFPELKDIASSVIGQPFEITWFGLATTDKYHGLLSTTNPYSPNIEIPADAKYINFD